MVSKRLMGVWAFFDFTLLAAGAVCIALSIVWRETNVLMNMVLSNADLTAGLVLGIAMLITFAISIGAIVQRNHITIGLVLLNWTLILDALGILIIGTFVWFFTLEERNNFHSVFSQQSTQNKIAIQDKLKCCGYFNTSDLLEVGGSICPSQDAANQLNTTCVGPITAFADTTLNDVFTTVYGFMAIVICLFLASLCVIKKRQEDERFKKIDSKRGGKGFV
ncbi:hypothetical protein PILCRDRAFT_815195 [Piloderma croceum F 1598]|uniref:Tetraspanin n=1 Tax=Piloderma croceum (strain F 1598) TaxID=765440 RepID=A0A0C3G7A0_PILCF|nr:hypothetical protein PILCRDRAFT_815195 [Piloderma croceum F 1598]